MKLFKKISIYFFTTIGLILIFLLCVIFLLTKGPSVTARNLFVNSAMESSAGKFLARIFLSKEQVEEIMNSNTIEEVTDVADSNLIKIDNVDKDKIEIIELKGSTYRGKMAIVHDPSRVQIGVSGPYGSSYSGKTVEEMAKSYNAVLATNGGGFEDAGGVGNGGTPIGIVIQDNKIVWGNESSSYEVIGFDNNDKLVVGKMTGKEALDRGVRDALSFGPILVVNGKPAKVTGTGGGLNPRTAIGQREDGAILLVVLEGRQANSLGASFADLISIFLEYGAVNAANLDGGSSSLLYYKGEYINNCASLYGPRNMPTSVIVR